MKRFSDVEILEDEFIDYYPTDGDINRQGRFYSVTELMTNGESRLAGPVKKFTKEEIAKLEQEMKKQGRL